eukprot:TRINITY_DN85169_c0_g1_i1.p1 TRINITY_DN85169_c0_g1~~TRINITY_DN85169_c0_g1_i1.p1  ORF type:complete len:333 (-),score=50.25 TRINITY_DN85169_c0_g1_i1:98-1096(-)
MDPLVVFGKQARAPNTNGEFFRFTSDKGMKRIIRMVDVKSDPLEPAKFKHKRVPRGAPSPPAPVNHSPPRPLSVKDMAAWKVPPCISNWKNPKGYTIPLNKRLAADGRGLQEVAVNDGFAKLSEALYVAEREARDEVEGRTKLAQKQLAKMTQARNDELRRLANQAREERARGTTAQSAPSSEARQRDEIRDERRREYEREQRLKKKGGTAREGRDRDISEKLALGQSTGSSRNAHYDSRLFNQQQGLASGFGEEDDYNIFDKQLFTTQTNIYRPDKEKIAKEQEAQAKQSTMQLEFEKDEEDPFGLGTLLQETKRDRDRGGDDRPSKRRRN